MNFFILNFSISHSVFYPFGELSTIFVTFGLKKDWQPTFASKLVRTLKVDMSIFLNQSQISVHSFIINARKYGKSKVGTFSYIIKFYSRVCT